LLSRTGVAMGTAGYMSPEQARGEKVDARTDLFSFGLVLYEMATGHRAFDGETVPELYTAILTQTPVPARELNPKLPGKLAQIISKALEKNRDARYQSVSDMRADLESVRRETERRSPLRRWMLTAGAVAVLLITISMLWFAKHPPSSSQTPPGLKLRQLTINSSENPVTSGAISPDGKYLAYTDVQGMHIKLIGSSASQSVPQPEALKNSKVAWEVGSAAWFPDNDRFLANAHPATEDPSAWSSQTTSIWIVPVVGGVPHKVRDGALAWAVSPDGTSISFGANKGKLGEREVWTMESNGEHARKLFSSNEGTAVCCLSWSPDEKRYVYISTDDSGDALLSRDVNLGPASTLVPASEMKRMNDIVWLHDGRLVYSSPETEGLNDVCNYWTMRLDLSTGQRVDKPRRLTNWASFCMGNGAATTDGKRLAFLGWSGFGTAYIADLEAGGTRIRNPRHFTLEEADDFVADWTADSGTVLVGANRRDHYGLYKQSLKSDTPEPIAPNVAGGVLNTAILSPDGKWIIAAVWPVASGQTPSHLTIPTQPLVRISFAGGSPELIFPMRLASPVGCARLPSTLCVVAERSDDRKQMIVTSFDPIKGRGSELARFDVDPNLDQNVDNVLVAMSPDGTRFAAARSADDPIEIRSLHGPPTPITRFKVPGKLSNIGWTANGKGLFAARHVHDGTELLHVDLQGKTTLLWKSNGPNGALTPSPDGRHVAVYDWKRTANMWMMENF
ncbi:MAG TPA: WD40 repeat domain-containing serine/threonine protein kinase, partial [Candidatus Acidoferrum sp.]